MGKTTVLRVKRRRDDPPAPSTFTLQPFALLPKSSSSSNNGNTLSSSKTKKQKSNEEAAHLTQLMHNSNFLKKRASHLLSNVPNHISTCSSSASASTSAIPVTTVNQNHNGLQSNDDNQALSIENNSGSANNGKRFKNEKAIIFRKVDGNSDDAFRFAPPASIHALKSQSPLSSTTSSFPPTTENSISKKNGNKKRKLDVVQVVEARLDLITSPPSPTNTATTNTRNKRQNSTNVEHQRHHKDENESGRPYQHQTKRKSISLQMVETRTMTETEFWNTQQQQDQQQQKQQTAFASAREGQRLTSTTALRARMVRDATTTNSKRCMISQSSSSSSRLPRRKRTSNNIILDPLSKRIDESLCTLTAMATNQTREQQHHFPHRPNSNTNDSNDPSTLMESHLRLLQSNFVPFKSRSKYFNWNCTNGTGTFLHCTALLNCVDIARLLCREYASILDITVKDSGGQTVREIAETCGSKGVVEVIDHYGGMMGIHINTSGAKKQRRRRGVEGCSKIGGVRDLKIEEREGEDYVYDLYWFQGDENNTDNEENEGKDEVCNENNECQGEEQYSNKKDKNNNDGGNDNLTGDTSATVGLYNHVSGQHETLIHDEKRQQCLLAATEAKDLPVIERSKVSLSMNGDESKKNTTNISNSNNTEKKPITVEMHGSVGYWNECGEYVLEAANISNDGNDEENIDMMTNDDDDDELDSNCEGFDANDYPEEEDENDTEEMMGEMAHHYYTQNSSFDHGQNPDPQDGSGPFMAVNMNGGQRYNTSACDSDYEDDYGEELNDFRNRPVDLNNYEGFGQHHAKRGDGFYADYSNNAEDDAEDDAYTDYIGLEHTRELSSTQCENQNLNAQTQYAYDPDFDG